MSIKRQLITLIISSVMLATFFAALHGYRNSIAQLDQVFDQELATMAHFIVAIAGSNSTFPKEIKGEFAYQVYKNNTLISHSLHFANATPLTQQQGYSEHSFYGQRWRTFTFSQAAFKVVVAQPIAQRIQSAESILFVTITPILLAIPLIALLIFYIIGKSLKPLITLSNALKNKSTDDLSQIIIHQPPLELAPVVTRLNHLLHRLDDSFEREKQLTANSAHELRTPVSVLAITAHNILQDFEKHTLQSETIVELQNNVARMAHVIEQIIALYRFTPENFHMKKQTIDIEAVLQEVVSNNYDELSTHQQNISLESTQHYVLGESFALYTLFENIVRNAIKYSGHNADIQITVTPEATLTLVTIEDSGPGISAAEMPLIFNRFYRAKSQQTRVKGSGLGLSIVKHIAEIHNGDIRCERSALGGLSITIAFPQLTTRII